VDEGTVKRYKGDLIDEVEPAINELIERTENGLKLLLKKESQLKAKASPPVVLLFRRSHHSQVEAAQARPPKPTAGTTMASQKLEQRRLHTLIKQKERLQLEFEELEAEVQALVCRFSPLHRNTFDFFPGAQGNEHLIFFVLGTRRTTILRGHLDFTDYHRIHDFSSFQLLNATRCALRKYDKPIGAA
jgi:hypothetical protein